jgi:ribosome-associated protein
LGRQGAPGRENRTTSGPRTGDNRRYVRSNTSPRLGGHPRLRAELAFLAFVGGGRLVNGVLTVRAEEHRSQLRNREAAKLRLAALLVEATAPPPKTRRPTKPSRRVQARRLENKRRRGEVKRGRSGRFDD